MPATFPYPAEVEQAMKVMYRSLWENDRRRYAAVEAAKLPHGGVDYIASLVGCDPKTIRRCPAPQVELPRRSLTRMKPGSYQSTDP